MLKNPKKADLDKDGELSSYERKRGMAIEKNMKAKAARGKMMKYKTGDMAKVKKVKAGLEKASRLHAGQAKQLGKVLGAKKGKMTGEPGGIFAQIKSLSPSMLDKVKGMLIQMKSAGKAGLKKKSLGGDIKKIKEKEMMKASMGMEAKGYGLARSKGMGLQDESVPMKDNSYIKDLI